MDPQLGQRRPAGKSFSPGVGSLLAPAIDEVVDLGVNPSRDLPMTCAPRLHPTERWSVGSSSAIHVTLCDKYALRFDYSFEDQRQIARIVNANATTLVISIGGLFAKEANAIIARLEKA